jgi:hypothetical protein
MSHMQPLTLDDLLSLEEYAGRRQEFFESHCRYLDRYRRARIGPKLTLIFENRQTLWYRVQEIIRVARLVQPGQLQRELDLYNRLLPAQDRLQAALIIQISDPGNLVRELAVWQEFRGDRLRLHVGNHVYPATLITSRPEDRCIGVAHWVQFTIEPASRAILTDTAQPAFLEYDGPNYHHSSDFLSEDLRQSLLDDLILSDRDASVKKAA